MLINKTVKHKNILPFVAYDSLLFFCHVFSNKSMDFQNPEREQLITVVKEIKMVK
jgi:hypothetical protein